MKKTIVVTFVLTTALLLLTACGARFTSTETEDAARKPAAGVALIMQDLFQPFQLLESR